MKSNTHEAAMLRCCSYIGLALILVLVPSCVDCGQASWQSTHARVCLAADIIARFHSGHRFDSLQIELLLDKPDFQGKASDLATLLQGDEYRDRVMGRLYEHFARYRDSEAAHVGVVALGWHDAEDFLGCQLWVYDESAHFDRPLWQPFAANMGFIATVFYLRDGVVIGSCPIVCWKPLARAQV